MFVECVIDITRCYNIIIILQRRIIADGATRRRRQWFRDFFRDSATGRAVILLCVHIILYYNMVYTNEPVRRRFYTIFRS